jgi:hypothetical protein
MPNSKISALTSATTPAAGTEVLPIVQSSATKQISIANLTAGRAVAADTLTVNAGGSANQLLGYASATFIWGAGRIVNGLALDSFDYIDFYTGSTSGPRTGTSKFRVSTSGNATVMTAGGLGYGTGAGGTVTQGTSRTTGVTLSKPTGAITMFSAAGSVVAATFTVTNTLVAATDTIILNQKSGTNLYVLLVTAVAAGSFNITFYTTGGVATDAPVINFAIIKGVTA